jgi:hypothetical protein
VGALAVVLIVAAVGVGLRAASAPGALVATTETTLSTTTSTVVDPPVSAAATTTTTIACFSLPKHVQRDVPATLDVDNGSRGTVFDVPVGTVFNVRLEHGNGCGGPYWSQPVVQPANVVRQAPGTDIGIGATALGTFEVIGAGSGTIVVPGGCGPLLACQHRDWDIEITARANPAPTTTTPPTTDPPVVSHLPATR